MNSRLFGLGVPRFGKLMRLQSAAQPQHIGADDPHVLEVPAPANGFRAKISRAAVSSGPPRPIETISNGCSARLNHVFRPIGQDGADRADNRTRRIPEDRKISGARASAVRRSERSRMVSEDMLARQDRIGLRGVVRHLDDDRSRESEDRSADPFSGRSRLADGRRRACPLRSGARNSPRVLDDALFLPARCRQSRQQLGKCLRRQVEDENRGPLVLSSNPGKRLLARKSRCRLKADPRASRIDKLGGMAGNNTERAHESSARRSQAKYPDHG
ncbi:MAG: hypothetical protein R3D52_09510 [Xanthobacteraceae bacterium]